MDNEMNMVLHKFKLDSKLVQNFQKSALSFDKNNSDKNNYYIDEEKDKLEKTLQKQINVYTKPIYGITPNFSKIKKISKLSLSPKNNIDKYYKKLSFNKEKFHMRMNEKNNKSKSLLVNLSSDYDYINQFSSKLSRNGSNNFNSCRLSINNESNTFSTINTKFYKNKIKINLKYSPVRKPKYILKQESLNNINDNNKNNDNDILINIRTNLNKGEDYIKINNKRLTIKSSLNRDDFFYEKI